MDYLVSGRIRTHYFDRKPMVRFEVVVEAKNEDMAIEKARHNMTDDLMATIDSVRKVSRVRLDPVPCPSDYGWDEPWYKSRLVAFDVETTGLDAESGRIVEIAFSEYNPETRKFEDPVEYLINDGVEIPQEATDIHGISNEMIADAPSFDDLAEDIHQKYIQNAILIAFNRSFDMKFLISSFRRAGKDYYIPPCMCGMELSYIIDIGKTKNNKLETIAAKLGVEGHNSHRAGDDAKLAGDTFMALARRHHYFRSPERTLREAINFFDHIEYKYENPLGL